MKIFLTAIMFFGLMFSAYGKILIGQVNVQTVLVTIKDGQAVKSKLSKVYEEKKKVLKDSEDKIRKAQQSYEKQQLVLSEKAKGKKELELRGMLEELQKKTMEYQKDMQDMENKLKKPILDKIKIVIDEISEKNQVDVTFEASQAPLVYAKDLKDLTDDVIAAYDVKYSEKAKK